MIKVGDYCPVFSLPNELDEIVDINEFLGQSILVLFFYPKDNTPGCTKEACTFRDTHDEFAQLGCKVFGLSADSPKSHQSFVENNRLQFSLLSDSKGIVRKLFGVPTNLFGLIPGRVTYVIGKDKKIQGIYNSQLDPVGHVKKALEFVKQQLN